jgi:hypothetical protein
MEITKELLKKEFEKYNKMYFNNELEMCEFRYYYFGSFGLYSMKCKNNKDIGVISFSKNVEWNEEMIKQIMIHEMIHHYVHTIEHVGFGVLSHHGKHFIRQIKRIKKEYNYEVFVCYPYWKFKIKKYNINNKLYANIINIVRNKLHLL